MPTSAPDHFSRTRLPAADTLAEIGAMALGTSSPLQLATLLSKGLDPRSLSAAGWEALMRLARQDEEAVATQQAPFERDHGMRGSEPSLAMGERASDFARALQLPGELGVEAARRFSESFGSASWLSQACLGRMRGREPLGRFSSNNGIEMRAFVLELLRRFDPDDADQNHDGERWVGALPSPAAVLAFGPMAQTLLAVSAGERGPKLSMAAAQAADASMTPYMEQDLGYLSERGFLPGLSSDFLDALALVPLDAEALATVEGELLARASRQPAADPDASAQAPASPQGQGLDAGRAAKSAPIRRI
jgi:hypothetical protein